MFVPCFCSHSANLYILVDFLMARTGKNPPAMWEIWVQSLSWEYPLETRMATNCSILAWKIPWTEEHDGLKSMGYKESDKTEQLPLSHLHLMQLIIKLYLHLPFCYLFSICFISLFLYYYNIAFFCVKHIHFGVSFLFSYPFLNYIFELFS